MYYIVKILLVWSFIYCGIVCYFAWSSRDSCSKYVESVFIMYTHTGWLMGICACGIRFASISIVLVFKLGKSSVSFVVDSGFLFSFINNFHFSPSLLRERHECVHYLVVRGVKIVA